MLELTAIETTLGTWIGQIRNDSTVTTDVLRELRCTNDDIVRLANEIVELDDQAHWQLDLIREQSARELCEVNRGYGAMTGYGATLHVSLEMDIRR
jgi:histidine ammonia-lyase